MTAIHEAGSDAAQSRLVTWRDPITTQAASASMPGLLYWRAVVDGHLPPPPIAELLRMHGGRRDAAAKAAGAGSVQ